MNELLLDRPELDLETRPHRLPSADSDPEPALADQTEWIITTIEYSLGTRMPAATSAATLLGLV